MTNPIITKIENTYNNETKAMNLGAEAKDIVVPLQVNGTTVKISLQSFAEYLYNYFVNGDFLSYGTITPNSTNVKLWYQHE